MAHSGPKSPRQEHVQIDRRAARSTLGHGGGHLKNLGLKALRLFKEKTMYRFALLISLTMLVGCAGLAGCAELEAQQGAASQTYFDERIQKCMRWASISYCRDEIYGDSE